MHSNSLEYNTEREKLIIPEYGRHIQRLIEHCKKLPNQEERNAMALGIIGVMGNLNPHLRDVPDFQHKLWDQFFIMADFDIDVDSPFEKPQKEVLYQKPDALNYPQKLPKYRFYGNSIPSMIKVALSWEEGPKQEALIINIANHMKKCFLNWNKDTVEDSVIFNHLYEMSDGRINLAKKDHDLAASKDLINKVSPRTKPAKKNYRKNNRKKNRY